MKIVLFIVVLCSSLTGYSQAHLDWLTYFGIMKQNTNGTHPQQVIYDSIRHYVYLAGVTTDTAGISTPAAHQEHYYSDHFLEMTNDIFLSKWDTSGNLIWATYFGGEGDDFLGNMGIDSSGNIVLCGYVNSDSNITTVGAFQQFSFDPNSLSTNNFLAKFSPDGNLVWSTYFGIGPINLYSGLTINLQNNDIYIAGAATIPGLSTPGVFQTGFSGGMTDGFIAKFDSSGSRKWCTYIGGAQPDALYNIILSKKGYLYACGSTSSLSNIASPGADITIRDQDTNKILGFLAKFDTTGQRIWSTYLGGNGDVDFFSGIKVVSDENSTNEDVFLYGRGYSTDLGTTGTYSHTHFGGRFDMILLKYNERGEKKWGTYIGGSDDEYALVPNEHTFLGFTNAMLIKDDYKNEEIQIAGGTQSTDFYFNPDCSYTPSTGNKKGFIVSVDGSGNMKWAKPFDEGINSISLAANKQYYISGITNIDGLATPGAFKDSKVPGAIAGFFAKINLDPCTDTSFTISKNGNILEAPAGFNNYQWSKNDTAIPGAIAATLDIQNFAVAIFKVTFQGDCECSYTSLPFNTDPTAINSGPDQQMKVIIHPNPASENVIIEGLEEGTVILFYNAIGQKALKITATHTKETIDISTLNKGIYTLMLHRKNGSKIFGKFAKD